MGFRRLYEDEEYEEYEGYFTDDRAEDERKIRDVCRCFNELNRIFNGYIEDIDDIDDFYFYDDKSKVGVSMTPKKLANIKSCNFVFDCKRIDSDDYGAYLNLLNTLYNGIHDHGDEINKILKHMVENDLTFNVLSNRYYREEFNLTFDTIQNKWTW